MIHGFFDGMLTLMLAKFMLNDVPHAAGFYREPIRWRRYWEELVLFVKKKDGEDINELFNLEEEYIRTGVQPQKSVEYYSKYESWATLEELNKVKKIISEYYFIAEYGPSAINYEEVVNNLFGMLSKTWTEVSLKRKGEYGRVKSISMGDPLVTITDSLNNSLKTALHSGLRMDRVFFIDAFMYNTHEHGMMITLDWPIFDYSPAPNALYMALEALGALDKA